MLGTVINLILQIFSGALGGHLADAARGNNLSKLEKTMMGAVGGVVGGRRLGQPEQGPDHALNLALAGPAGAADRHLDRLRRVGEAADAALRRGQHRDAAGLAYRHRGPKG